MIWVLIGLGIGLPIACLGFACLVLSKRTDDTERAIRYLSAGENKREDREAISRIKTRTE